MQTETPDQLKAFNDSAQKGCKRKVVQRQAVVVLTQGTLTDPCMVSDSPHATYVATMVEEVPEKQSDKVTVGVCMVDTAASTLLLGQFEDDKMRSQTLKYFTGAHTHAHWHCGSVECTTPQFRDSKDLSDTVGL